MEDLVETRFLNIKADGNLKGAKFRRMCVYIPGTQNTVQAIGSDTMSLEEIAADYVLGSSFLNSRYLKFCGDEDVPYLNFLVREYDAIAVDYLAFKTNAKVICSAYISDFNMQRLLSALIKKGYRVEVIES